MKDLKPKIKIEDLEKIDMRIGLIINAIAIEGADRLYKLEVKFDDTILTVVSAIKAWFKPEDLIGKKMPFIVNLELRKLKGIESQAMIVMASWSERLYGTDSDNTNQVFMKPLSTNAPSDTSIF